MRVETRYASPGTAVVAVVGEVDLATAPVLHAALLDALTTNTPAVVHIDLSACTFLDCSGIRVLVSAHATAQANGCRMWTRHPQPLVRTVLEVTGLLDIFTAPHDSIAPNAADDHAAGPASPRTQTAAVALALGAV